MKKDNIRSKYVKDALADSYNLSKSIIENSRKTIEELLKEQVNDRFRQILGEGIGDPKDGEDTDDEDKPEITDVDAPSLPDGDQSKDGDDTVNPEGDTVSDTPEGGEDSSVTSVTVTDATGDDSTDDGWDEYDDFKLSDGEYDMTGSDENAIKVFKLMDNNDEIKVIPSGEGQFHVKDNQNGSEFIIDTNPSNDDDSSSVEGDSMDEQDQEDNQNVYEVALKEYDSHVGYTDSYQKNDVMTNDGVKEPGKNVNDWDKGLPHDTKRPWGGEVKKTEPFNKKVNEQDEPEIEENCQKECGVKEGCNKEDEGDETQIEEANLSQSRWNDTHAAHNRVPAANKDEYRRQGIQKTSKGTKYRATGTSDEGVNEDIRLLLKKMQGIISENKELKKRVEQVNQLMETVKVTNKNLGNIVRVIVNNATTLDEKKEIVGKIGSAKTVDESNRITESIISSLSGKSKLTEQKLNIDRQYGAEGSQKINEARNFVQDDGLERIRQLMKKVDNYIA